jgi:hypothetical protein
MSTEASFRGRVQPLSIADLLSFLADLKRDGLLTVAGQGVVIDLYLEAGRLVYATSSRARDDLSELLLRWKCIAPERFDAAMQQVAEGARLDRALLDRGGMSPRALQRARARQALHIVLPLFEWRDGEFRFFEGEAPQGELPRVDLPIPEIVAAGIRALRDPGLFAERIPSLDRVFEAIAPDRERSVPVALRPAETFVLDLVDGSRTIGALIKGSGQPDREVRRTLFLLSSLGRIKAGLHRGGEAAEVASRAEQAGTGEIVRQFNGMFGRVYRYLMREIGPISDHLLRRSLGDMQSDHPILFSGSSLGVDGTLDLPPIRDNLAGLRGDQGRGLLVDGPNELLYRELLVLRRTLGAEHEKRVLTGFRREMERPEIRA